ncbi:MAG: nitrile hydratase subunit alpha [Schwartzia sp.]|nr:nitrile hydratase subunit alpha [Schwartzia sp. (in: firmicutes)]
MTDKKQDAVKYGEVVAKCWENEAYRKRFIEDPESVLAEAGVSLEKSVTYKVVEQPRGVKYIVLPCEGAKDAVQAVTKGLLTAAEAKSALIPEGAEVRIIQNTENIRYMILPASPKNLSKQELSMAAGGNGTAVSESTSVVTVADLSTAVTQVDQVLLNVASQNVVCVEPTTASALLGTVVVTVI